MKNLSDMVTSYKGENTDFRRICMERLDAQRNKFSKFRDDFEMRCIANETLLRRIQDEQKQITTQVSHMDEEVFRLDKVIDKAQWDIADIWRSKASVNSLEEQTADLKNFMNHVDAHVASLRMQFGTLVDDVKKHFEDAVTIVSRSTSQQTSALREQYDKDMKRIDKVQCQLEEHVGNHQSKISKLNSDMTSLQEDNTSTVESVDDTIKQLEHKLDNYEREWEMELSSMRKHLQETTATVEVGGSTNRGGFGEATEMFKLFLESAWIGALCELQDEKDRQNIGLFGFKTNPDKEKAILPDIAQRNGFSAKPTESPRRLRGGSDKLRQAASDGFRETVSDSYNEPVFSIDARCLSCAASNATVLAGFKFACLHYRAGGVEYEGHTYNRSELLQKRADLLSQARDEINHMHHEKRVLEPAEPSPSRRSIDLSFSYIEPSHVIE